MNKTEHYDEQFFRELEAGSRASARAIIPILRSNIEFSSVIDVGCGNGVWLAEFQEAGIEDFQGIDGEYVDASILKIPTERFSARDLSKAFEADRKFDLAVSLEVAEHLPEGSADVFVQNLTRLAPVVLFSAAIPLQRGHGHINLQWPRYWIAKFEESGYTALDCLRPLIWNNKSIDWWYRQNMMLFAAESAHDRLSETFLNTRGIIPFDVIHPDHFAVHARRTNELDELMRKWPFRTLLEIFGVAKRLRE